MCWGRVEDASPPSLLKHQAPIKTDETVLGNNVTAAQCVGAASATVRARLLQITVGLRNWAALAGGCRTGSSSAAWRRPAT